MARASTSGFRKRLISLRASLRMTGAELGRSLRERDPSRAYALLKEGSPLESALSEVIYVVFAVLLFAPLVLVPAYYLFLSLA